jgi:hypothetical protein
MVKVPPGISTMPAGHPSLEPGVGEDATGAGTDGGVKAAIDPCAKAMLFEPGFSGKACADLDAGATGDWDKHAKGIR